MPEHLYRYAIIGTGLPHGAAGSSGFGMCRLHYPSFIATQRVTLAAVCDLHESRARAFLEKHETQAPVYTDYREMLTREKPDIVSITTWPDAHAELTVAACEAGVRGVHCEKPMATTWADAKRMQSAAHASGTVLTFNHQRRFLEPFQRAKQMLSDGEIGDLLRIEGQTDNLYDWGTHWLDMFCFYNDEQPAEWVIAQVDARHERRVFGAPVDDQGILHYKFRNGVRTTLVTGHEANIGAQNRLIGTAGVIEVGAGGVNLRVQTSRESGWRAVETREGMHNDVAIHRAAADLVRALDEPAHKPLLSVDNAIHSAEVIFAAFESARYRGRIDLPLQAEGNALEEMLQEKAIGPNRVDG